MGLIVVVMSSPKGSAALSQPGSRGGNRAGATSAGFRVRPTATKPRVQGEDRRWWVLVAAALTLATVGNWETLTDDHRAFAVGLPWWSSALTVLGLAAWRADRRQPRPDRPPWTRADSVAVAVVLAGAALFRLWGIDRYPPSAGFGFEEYQTGGLAFRTVQNWLAPTLEFPLTNFLPAVSFRVFGLSGWALRAPFLASGIVAPVFLYLALRRVTARPAAWAGAMLLAGNRWAGAAARFADEIFFPISLVALAAWLWVRVLQERRQLGVFALSLVLSDFFYAYSGYRGLPLIVLAGSAVLAVRRRPNRPAAAHDRQLFTMALAVWGVMLGPGIMTVRAGESSLFFEAIHRHGDAWGSGHLLAERVAAAVARLRLGWGVFALAGDEFPTVNIPNEPMFDPITAALATLAVGVALVRRDAGRRLALAVVAIPFFVLALIPANFNVSRYFVLLVPIFFLLGYLFDDVRRWLGRGGSALPIALVVGIVGLNFRGLLRVIDSPVVQASFGSGENTVLAAIHAVPAGSRVVLLTVDGSNAFEPSDYLWLTVHAQGGRAASLDAALRVAAEEGKAVYWITQGRAEGALLPALVASVCPGARSKVWPAATPEATVGVSWIEPGSACGERPAQGLRGVYRVVESTGNEREVSQIDPALCAYTIPWSLGWELQDRQIQSLHVEWQGRISPTTEGEYRLRLEVQGARAALLVDDRETQVDGSTEQWTSAYLPVTMATEPLALRIRLDAQAGNTPRVRLYWTPPGGEEHLIPPNRLQPARQG